MSAQENLNTGAGEFVSENKNKMTAEERILATVFGLSDEQKAEILVRTPEDKTALLARQEADRLRRREEFIAASSDPEFYSRQSDLIQPVIERALKELTPIEAQVVSVRFGLDRGRQRSLAETAQEVSRHKRTVQRIEARALKKLRTSEEGSDLRVLGSILKKE